MSHGVGNLWMVFKNLFRRKGRTILTIVGIAIGVAAIVALGTMADSMRAGYGAIATGSKADLVLTKKGAVDITLGGVDERVADELRAWPEVAAVDGMVMGLVQAEKSPYFFLFGYDPEGFSVERFRIVEGQGLREARHRHDKPLILGRGAADALNKKVGDTFHVTGGTFRVVGIYETGDALEEAGAVIPLREAQDLLHRPRSLGLLYVRLRHPEEEARLQARVERQFPDLTLTKTAEFADRQIMVQTMEAFAWGIAFLAVIIGGVGMTNTLFMSVFERTQEIGLLRSLGWRRSRVLRLILGESLVLSALGGLAGLILGIAAVLSLRGGLGFFGALGARFSPDLFARAAITVGALGLVGGLYPAWWASRLVPLEALRYEGGADVRVPRFIPGGMTVRNLWRRRTRTALTLLGIGMSIAAIVALGGIMRAVSDIITSTLSANQAELAAMEAGVSDTSYSSIDQRVGARIAALPDVEAVAGMVLAVASSERAPLILVFGYHPQEFAIRHFRIVEGEPLTTSRQAIVGRQLARTLGLKVGSTLRLLQSTFRVVGIFETGIGWEDNSVIVHLRDAQMLADKPRQVTWYTIKLREPSRAEAVRDYLNAHFPEIQVSLTSEFVENMPDMQQGREMVRQIAFLAVLIGAVGMLNTMLMSVLERTREIGVLRALGWSRRRVLGTILREALALGLFGAAVGIPLGMGMAWALNQIPLVKGLVAARYDPDLFLTAVAVALGAGVIGGLYPAWRATRLQPVEALRYE
ncbi:MAG: ABC transporter permease [Anaerolineae bacterium]